jgi:hypothetical protein
MLMSPRSTVIPVGEGPHGTRVIQQYREHPELLERVAELDADFVRAVKGGEFASS